MTIGYTVLDNELGPLFIAETRKGLAFLTMGDDGLSDLTGFAGRWYPGEEIKPTVVESAGQVLEYLDGERQIFDIEIDLNGTEFQKSVWDVLAQIPYGQTMTYSEVAAKVGLPNAPRAIGQACGANPVAIVIPCHRVLTTGGGLGGFGGGLQWKQWLLDLEKRTMA